MRTEISYLHIKYIVLHFLTLNTSFFWCKKHTPYSSFAEAQQEMPDLACLPWASRWDAQQWLQSVGQEKPLLTFFLICNPSRKHSRVTRIIRAYGHLWTSAQICSECIQRWRDSTSDLQAFSLKSNSKFHRKFCTKIPFKKPIKTEGKIVTHEGYSSIHCSAVI